MYASEIQRDHSGKQLVVWSASNTSAELNLKPYSAHVLYLPADFAGSSISFLHEPNGLPGTWAQVYDPVTNALLSQSVTAGKSVQLSSKLFGCGKIKIVSSSSESTTGHLSSAS